MTTAYYAGFDVSALTLGTLTVADTSGSGGTSVVITLASVVGAADSYSRFTHYNPGASGGQYYFNEAASGENALRGWSLSSWGLAVQSDIRAGITAAGDWPGSSGDFDVTLDNDTALYTFTYTSQISLTWSVAAGRSLFGFASNQSGAVTYTGTIVPTYAVVATFPCSFVTPNHEEPGIAKFAMADDGLSTTAMAKPYAPLRRDWAQRFEHKAKVFREHAAAAHPETLQGLFEQCRCVNIFVVHDGFGESYAEAFVLRSDGGEFTPQRVAPGYDVDYHVPFRCYVAARVELQVPA